jgi:hypothetical protein
MSEAEVAANKRTESTVLGSGYQAQLGTCCQKREIGGHEAAEQDLQRTAKCTGLLLDGLLLEPAALCSLCCA